jgi:DNA-directed RNA polymerase subunit RPC12/RpoP
MEIYQTNYFKNDITYKCKECGKENVYRLDFQKIIDKFDKFDLSDEVFTTDDKNYTYKFTLNFPLVRTVSNFYKDYMKKYKGTDTIQRQVLDNLGNIDYINLFIKQVELIDKADTNDRIVADLTLMTYAEVEKFIDQFPQNIIFSENGGVMNYITQNFIEKLNQVFQYEKCEYCGAESNEGIGSLIDFF